MDLVLIESPFAGDVVRNKAYAKECVRDCLHRGEAPYASHLFFTQEGLLDDTVEHERALGIKAGLAWGTRAKKTVVYLDHGISKGMVHGIIEAAKVGRPIELRRLRGPVTSEDVIQLNEIRAGLKTGGSVSSLLSEVVGSLLAEEGHTLAYASAYEGYAFLQEALDSLWASTKANKLSEARSHALVVASRSLKFLRDFPFSS